jgi:hypothetical protein
MDAASGGQPARGVVVGRLTEVHSDRIVIGSATLYLRDGASCTHVVRMTLGVVYTEQDGRRYMDSVAPLSG